MPPPHVISGIKTGHPPPVFPSRAKTRRNATSRLRSNSPAPATISGTINPSSAGYRGSIISEIIFARDDLASNRGCFAALSAYASNAPRKTTRLETRASQTAHFRERNLFWKHNATRTASQLHKLLQGGKRSATCMSTDIRLEHSRRWRRRFRRGPPPQRRRKTSLRTPCARGSTACTSRTRKHAPSTGSAEEGRYGEGGTAPSIKAISPGQLLKTNESSPATVTVSNQHNGHQVPAANKTTFGVFFF